MSSNDLQVFAREAGLLIEWEDVHGRPRRTPDATLETVLAALDLPADTPQTMAESRAKLAARKAAAGSFLTADVGRPRPLPTAVAQAATTGRLRLEDGQIRDIVFDADSGLIPAIDVPGYHQLEVGERTLTLAVAPPEAWGLDDANGGRSVWGLAVQLYSLRGRSPTAFGGFRELAECAQAAGERGAQALAVSPVHALFAADPERYSPYAPSSRLFLNSLYADPTAVLGPTLAGGSAEADTGELIDWAEAAPTRLTRLRQIHQRFLGEAGDALRTDLEAFRRQGGDDLLGHARFEALHRTFFEQTGARGWPDWPAEYQDPASAAVARFAEENAEEVDFHLFLQWLADRSLAHAQAEAEASGMALGLITDVAVGMDPGGSHAWSRPQDLLAGLNVGAPPDAFQARGQDWGVTAFSPHALAANGYEGFLATLRSAMRHAGGVRIDHILGLRRLWVVPHGAAPTEGAYLAYPIDDLLRLIALESHRHEAMVVGEDLGTVPAGFGDVLAARGVRGMRVLLFEQDKGEFRSPERWSPRACALTTTHDLPPVAGWWRETDIDWRVELNPDITAEDEADLRDGREQEREALWQAFSKAGCASGPQPSITDTEAVVDAAIAYVSRSASELAIIPIEDLLGLEAQPNLPGTTTEHPNWRRRLTGATEALLSSPGAERRIASLKSARPR